jgi:sulfite exporter TauE/SafE
MRLNRNENIFQLTHRLSHTHNRNAVRCAGWVTLCVAIYLAWTLVNAYSKITTGHTLLECSILHAQGCQTQSMRIHGE